MIRIEDRAFDELAPAELYEALALRQRVFVVEQRCIYLDADGRDSVARHLLGWEAERLVAYARILPAGERFPEHAIGRVVVAPEARGRGFARALVRRAIAAIHATHGDVAIALSAQAYLERFYASLGFRRTSEVYDEDGIDHVDMRRPPGALD